MQGPQPSLLFASVPPERRVPDQVVRERGTQVVGANPTVGPWEAQALSALARQLTPQADERGCVLRVSDSQCIFLHRDRGHTVAASLAPSPPAPAGCPPRPRPRPAPRTAAPVAPIHTDPVTQKTTNVAYNGPGLREACHRRSDPLRAGDGHGDGATSSHGRRRPTGGQPPLATTPAVTTAKPDLLVPGTPGPATSTVSPPRRVGAGGGPGSHLGGQPDRSASPTSSAAVTPRSSRPAMTARAPSPSPSTARTCCRPRRTPRNSNAGAPMGRGAT